jgi:hypothetical protein
MTDRELMQMALDALKNAYSFIPMKMMERHLQAETALRDRLAQPERVHAIDISQERVDETAKNRHEWVGLSDEEIDAAVKLCNTVDTYKYFRAIEAKLKEKNT